MDFNKALSEASKSRTKESQELVAKYYEYLGNLLEQFNQDKDAAKLTKATEDLQKSFLKRLVKTQAKKPVTFSDEEKDEVAEAEIGEKRTSTVAGFEERVPTSKSQDSSTITGFVEKGEIKINIDTDLSGKTISTEGMRPHEQKWPVATVEREPQFWKLASVLDVASYFGIPSFCMGVMTLLLFWITEFLPRGNTKMMVIQMAHEFYEVIEGRFADLVSAKGKIVAIIRKLYEEPKPTKKSDFDSHSNFRTSFIYTSAPDSVKRAISSSKR